MQADYVFGGYVDHVVQMRRGGGEYYLHADSTFSVAAVSNAAGAVVTRYAYGSIYGTSSILAGSDVGNPWRFQGHRWDPESGFYQFRARYLDPALGRFVSRDPLGLWGDASNVGNGYTFCGNDPVNKVDPFGLEDGEIDWDRLIGSSYALFVMSLNPATAVWGPVGVVFANNTETGQGVLRGGGRAIREPCEAAASAWWTGVKERASAFWEGTTTAGPLYGLYMSTWTGLKQTVSGAIDGVTSIPEQFTSTGSAFGDAYEAYLAGDYEGMSYHFGRAWLGSGMLIGQGIGLGSFLRSVFGRIKRLWTGKSSDGGGPPATVESGPRLNSLGQQLPDENGLLHNLIPEDVPGSPHRGELVFQGGKWRLLTSTQRRTARGRMPFVVTSSGRVLVSTSKVDRGGTAFGHIDISRGEPVRFAGMIEFTRSGKIKLWNNDSGHYKPVPEVGAGIDALPQESYVPIGGG